MHNSTLPVGKTNQRGRMLYGRATRHKDVKLCSLGALAFYLAERFHVSKEFDNFPESHWLLNEKWFDVKLLTDAYGDDHTKELSDSSYSDSIRETLAKLNLNTNKLKHLGRGLGSKILEALQLEAEWIRQLGNWNPTIQEDCYSTKLPMAAIRAAAGFEAAGGMYHNPRTTVPIVDEELRQSTPFAKFEVALDFVLERHRLARVHDEQKWTALQFLHFMKELNTIFLQDAAAMLILHPERSSHPIFTTPALAATRTPPNNTTIQQTIQQNGDFYCLSPKYQTVHQLWNEWFGLGAFQGKPVPGGFAALEEQQGTKWRKQFDAAQKAQISRVKRTIKGIEDLSKHPSMDLQQALWSWNTIYVEDCNKSLSRFVMTISSLGGMSKRKSRGRHLKISE